jgi:SAM-dependent methyltransferase
MRWTSGVRPFAPFNQSALERHPHHEVIKTFRYVVTLHAMLQRGTPAVESQLLDTRRAFDSVAVDYDGPRGNNVLIQRMRRALWNVVRDELPPGSRLLDLGCGTGIDAAEFARCGYRVTATDWSPRMVERTRALAAHAATCSRIDARHLGIHQLDQIEGKFDGIYSDLGPLNCVPDLEAAAAECARLLRPGGKLVCSVIGRICPWEIAHYALRGRLRRAWVRAARGLTPVGMNRHTIWTRYYLPREFYRVFAEYFSLCGYRSLGLFMPPPYLVDYYRRHQRWCDWLGRLDDRLGAVPLLRGMGDHFLIVMSARSRS